MGFTWPTILIVSGLGVLQLAAGIIIGRCWPTRSAVARKTQADTERLEQAIRQVFGLVGSVAGDVDQHRVRLEQANQELAALGPDEANLTAVVLGTVGRILDVNEHLRTRLGDTERQLEHQAEQLQRQLAAAMTDPLTQLPNRRAFEAELERRMTERREKGVPFCLLVLDVDYFKTLNDHFGHPMGDEVLRRMAQVFTGGVSEADLVARVGGEEFAVILPRTAIADAVELADRLRRAVAATVFAAELAHLKITVSLGLAESLPGETAALLVKRADEALYASKHGGRNCGHYHDGRTCRRIVSATESGGLARLEDEPRPEGGADDRHELNDLCGAVRARLAELTGKAK